MEGPAAIGMASLAITGDRHGTGALIGLLLWEIHYVYRAFIYPFRLRGPGRTMPVIVALSGATFQLTNTYLNGRWLFALGPDPSEAAGGYLRIAAGAALFAVGLVIHQHADHVLLTLRAPGETGYKIPRGGLYRFVSCPNYLGEILAWTGFAIVCASKAGVLFAVWSTANLLPRALSNHRWYKEKFSEYPQERRALVPFLL